MECISRTMKHVYKSYTGSYSYRGEDYFIDCECPTCRGKRIKDFEDGIMKDLEYMRAIPHAYEAPTRGQRHATLL